MRGRSAARLISGSSRISVQGAVGIPHARHGAVYPIPGLRVHTAKASRRGRRELNGVFCVLSFVSLRPVRETAFPERTANPGNGYDRLAAGPQQIDEEPDFHSRRHPPVVRRPPFAPEGKSRRNPAGSPTLAGRGALLRAGPRPAKRRAMRQENASHRRHAPDADASGAPEGLPPSTPGDPVREVREREAATVAVAGGAGPRPVHGAGRVRGGAPRLRGARRQRARLRHLPDGPRTGHHLLGRGRAAHQVVDEGAGRGRAPADALSGRRLGRRHRGAAPPRGRRARRVHRRGAARAQRRLHLLGRRHPHGALGRRRGRCSGFAKVTRDLTARRAADALLQAAAVAAEAARADAEAADRGEERVPGHHEPRDPHAHQRRHGLRGAAGPGDRRPADGDRSGGTWRASAPAAGTCSRSSRGAGLLAHRGRADRPSARSRVQAGRRGRRRARRWSRRRRRRAASSCPTRSAATRRAMSAWGDEDARAADPRQPARPTPSSSPSPGGPGASPCSAGTAATPPADARLAGAGPWVYVRVEDTGPGIAAGPHRGHLRAVRAGGHDAHAPATAARGWGWPSAAARAAHGRRRHGAQRAGDRLRLLPLAPRGGGGGAGHGAFPQRPDGRARSPAAAGGARRGPRRAGAHPPRVRGAAAQRSGHAQRARAQRGGAGGPPGHLPVGPGGDVQRAGPDRGRPGSRCATARPSSARCRSGTGASGGAWGGRRTRSGASSRSCGRRSRPPFSAASTGRARRR